MKLLLDQFANVFSNLRQTKFFLLLLYTNEYLNKQHNAYSIEDLRQKHEEYAEALYTIEKQIDWSYCLKTDKKEALNKLIDIFQQSTSIDHIQEYNVQIHDMLNYIDSKSKTIERMPDTILHLIRCILSLKKVHSLCEINAGYSYLAYDQSEENQKFKYIGYEADPDYYVISNFLHAMNKNTNAITYNSIQDIEFHHPDQQSDCVFLNSPFLKNNYQLQNDLYKSVSINNEWELISSIFDHNLSNDAMIALVTKGALSRGSSVRYRHMLLHNLEAVITLPINLYSGTSLGVELLIFNKEKQEHIVLIDLSNFTESKTRFKHTITDQGLNTLTRLLASPQNEEGICKIVHHEQIYENGYDLNPGRYIGEPSLDYIRLNDIASIQNGIQEKPIFDPCSQWNYINITDLKEDWIKFNNENTVSFPNKRAFQKYSIQKDDILLVSKSFKIHCNYVYEDPVHAIAGSGLTIIRVDQKVCHPYIIYEYLNTAEGKKNLESLISSTTIKVLSTKNLTKMKIPLYLINNTYELGHQLRKDAIHYHEQQKKLSEEYEITHREALDKLHKLRKEKEPFYE